eukprot:scaffold51616_cov343-Isochrysis_galbana.AAC.1
MPGGARSRRTIDCTALGAWRPFGRFPPCFSEGEKLSRVYARCPPAPAAQGPHPALGPHPRQVLRATKARHAA